MSKIIAYLQIFAIIYLVAFVACAVADGGCDDPNAFYYNGKCHCRSNYHWNNGRCA